MFAGVTISGQLSMVESCFSAWLSRQEPAVCRWVHGNTIWLSLGWGLCREVEGHKVSGSRRPFQKGRGICRAWSYCHDWSTLKTHTSWVRGRRSLERLYCIKANISLVYYITACLIINVRLIIRDFELPIYIILLWSVLKQFTTAKIRIFAQQW